MAIKASNQISIVDITDAYSVMMSSEAYTFPASTTKGVGSGKSCTTTIVAFCGSNQCTNVAVDASAITCNSNVLSPTVSGSGTSAVTITFTTVQAFLNTYEATIPVVVTYGSDTVTVNKKFTVAVARMGATGSKGDTGDAGADAILVTIETSNGSVFKNSTGSTVLTARVFVGGVEQEITTAGVCGDLGSINWYKGASTTAVATANALTVSASDVASSEVYTCRLEA